MGVFLLIVSFLTGYCLVKQFLRIKRPVMIISGALLSGCVFSSILLYLLDLLFVYTLRNYWIGSIVFILLALVYISISFRNSLYKSFLQDIKSFFTDRWAILVFTISLVFSSWLYYQCFRPTSSGDIVVLNCQTDSLYHTSYLRSISIGHNIPVERTYYSGVNANYHFMFDYYSAKMSQLGLNSVHSMNIMALLGLALLLLLIFEFCRIYFESNAVGVLGSVFFVFHSSITGFIWIFQNYSDDIWSKIWYKIGWLHGKAEYEGWGLLNLGVFQAQKMFPFALAVMVFIVTFIFLYRKKCSTDSGIINTNSMKRIVFVGVFAGLMVFWHILVAAFCIFFIGAFSITLLKNRKFFLEMVICAFIAAILAYPQYLLYKAGADALFGYPAYHLGYGADIQGSSLWSVISAIAIYYYRIIGVKLIVLGLALLVLPLKKKLDYLILSVPFIIGNLLQIGPVLYDNNKFIILSIVFFNCYTAFFVIWLYKKSTGLFGKLHRPLAIAFSVLLIFSLTLSGIIDFMSVKNQLKMTIEDESSSFVKWIREETDPDAVFLTYFAVPLKDNSITPIRLAGRRFYVINNNNDQCDKTSRIIKLKKIYTFKGNPEEIKNLIKEEKIDYIIVDDLVRKNPDYEVNENEIKKHLKLEFSHKGTDVYVLE